MASVFVDKTFPDPVFLGRNFVFIYQVILLASDDVNVYRHCSDIQPITNQIQCKVYNFKDSVGHFIMEAIKGLLLFSF